MTDRVKKLYARHNEDRVLQLCVEKAEIMTRSFDRNEGWPEIIKRAKAVEEYLDNRTIFIMDDEILVGNQAEKYRGMEMKPMSAGWPDEDLDTILNSGMITMSDEERKRLRALDDYWIGRGKTMDEQYRFYYDDERLFPFNKRGFVCPPWTPVTIRGQAGEGWGLKGTYGLMCPDWGIHLQTGFRKYIDDVKAELRKIHLITEEDFEKYDFYTATIIVYEAAIRMANRYADLADSDAEKKDAAGDHQRAAELREMAEICRRVPEYPARTFREGMQAFIFYWYMLCTMTLGIGRFDQYMYPLYKADKEAGRITDDEVLELLECMRLKMMEFQYIGGGKFQREKLSGMARWNNIILGGCDSEGKECTNELTYLIIKAAKEVRTPHPTLTVRVSKNTPKQLMDAAIDLVSTGCGFPAFISEDQYIDYIVSRGVPLEIARQFSISGCLDIAVPGRSRMFAIPMFVVPTVLELALNDGCNPADGVFYGEHTGTLGDYKSYDEFYEAFLAQLRKMVSLACEKANIKQHVDAKLYPDAFVSGFFHDTLKEGRDVLQRRMLYENTNAINVVGMVNVIDSLAAIKKLVFDDKVVTGEELNKAINANWEGYEEIRRMCLEAPKYGNDIDYVDAIGEKFWCDLRDIIESNKTSYGVPYVTSSISVSAHAPGGRFTGATADGRKAGVTLADGSVSPSQGMDKNGPTAVFNSARRMAKGWSVELLNMKFTPSALKTQADRDKLASLIRVFLTNGGKHVQFNVVNKETLLDAQVEKEKHKDLLVRVAGYSTYFVNLSMAVQNEIIARTEHEL